VKRSHHEQPCAWYTALQSVAQHIVAEEFRDSRLEPHEYGRLGPEDEDSFSDSDASDSEDSPQSATGRPPLNGGRSAALIPDSASLSLPDVPSSGLEYGQDPLLSTDEELWELLDSSSARVDVAPLTAATSSASYTLASLSPGPSMIDGSAAAIARRLLEARRILAAKAGAARPPSPDIEVDKAFEELTFAKTDGVAGPPRPFAPWMDLTDIPPGRGRARRTLSFSPQMVQWTERHGEGDTLLSPLTGWRDGRRLGTTTSTPGSRVSPAMGRNRWQ